MGRQDRERRDRAFDKGARDWRRSRGLAGANPVTEFFHPNYRPPKGEKRSYDAGRRYAGRRYRERRRR